MSIPLDYEALRIIWWLLLGVLLIGFAIMDGFDLGTAMLLPFVARTDTERRVTINAIGPFWEGNQVWLILGGGAVFAAWPPVYATSFSGFYIAMFLVLAALIVRPVGFDFRNKIADPRWRTFWDYALFAGGLVPSVVFGVAFGNLLQGVPFRIDSRFAHFLRGQRAVRAAQSIRPALRPVIGRNARHPWRNLSGAEDRRDCAGARAKLRQGRRRRHHRAVCYRRPLGLARHRRLRHHQRGRRGRSLQSAFENRRASARPVARALPRARLDGHRARARLSGPVVRSAVHRRRAAWSRRLSQAPSASSASSQPLA